MATCELEHQAILLIERDAEVAGHVRRCLEEAGARVSWVGFEHAQRTLEKENPSVAMVDCDVTSGEYRAFLRLLRRRRLPLLLHGLRPPTNATTERNAFF